MALSTGISRELESLQLFHEGEPSPCTPPKRRRLRSVSPPAAPGGRTPLQRSPLLEALYLVSHDRVQEALNVPDPAQVLMDVQLDILTPPLSIAVAQRCPARTVALLLRLGADPEAIDKFGETTATMLSKMTHTDATDWQQFSWEQAPVVSGPGVQWSLEVALLLVRLGAVDPDSRARCGQCLAEIAEASGNPKLARFWRHCRVEQALAPIIPAVKKRRGDFGRLPQGVMVFIFRFVTEDWILALLALHTQLVPAEQVPAAEEAFSTQQSVPPMLPALHV